MASLPFTVTLMGAFCVGLSQANGYYDYYNRYYYSRFSPSAVGFTAVKTANQEFASDAVVTFDKVITNVGKAFQASSNEVKIPTTGLYYFSFFVQTNSTDTDVVELIRNGNRVISSMGLNAANAAVLFLKKGDKLFLRGRADTLIIGTTDTKTTFNGFLIKSGFFGHSYH